MRWDWRRLGLVADVVPLRDENRILVRHGLERIRTNPSVGLKALLDASGVKPDQAFTAEDVGFKLAPRLNAAGRLGYAGLAVELLTTTMPHLKAAELGGGYWKVRTGNDRHSNENTRRRPRRWL